MTPNESLAAFTAFAASHGVALTASLPREGLGQMLSFFQSAAAPRCKGPDSDMLLYQWGAYDWGKGLYFELNITRQFIENDLQDDDAISQLSLTYKFEPTPERVALGDGNRWCHSHGELASLEEFVKSSPCFIALASTPPVAIELTHSYV